MKRALLEGGSSLALFFGRKELNDKLLPLLITCLNSNDWRLKAAFFKAIAEIGAHAGRESLEVFLLPCIEQALMDPKDSAVVAAAVREIEEGSADLPPFILMSI